MDVCMISCQHGAMPSLLLQVARSSKGIAFIQVWFPLGGDCWRMMGILQYYKRSTGQNEISTDSRIQCPTLDSQRELRRKALSLSLHSLPKSALLSSSSDEAGCMGGHVNPNHPKCWSTHKEYHSL